MRQKGFTIVELLIVIAVVAILAAITVVSYNGASQRARNAARITTVEKARDALRLTMAKYLPQDVKLSLNGEDIGTPTEYWSACIGTGYVGGKCGVYQNDPPYAIESTAFNTLLQQGSGALPNFSTYPPSKSNDGDVVSGPYIQTVRLAGESKDRLAVEYSLEGEKQPCLMTPLIYGFTGIGAGPTLTKPAGDAANYSSSGDGVTECRFVIANL
jgi:prepilin-type N-terminal cleavage/methylation domain-containing protein